MGISSWLGRAIVIVTIGLALAFAYLFFLNPPSAYSSPYVKILRVAGGEVVSHGSGTYVGKGLILTSRHVVTAEAEYEILAQNGDTYPAKVIAQDGDTDSAVLQIDIKAKLETSPVSCRLPIVGEVVNVTGNPYDQLFVSLWGRVAGLPKDQEIAGTAIKSAMTIDMTVTPGVSGSGVRDTSGNIIGIITASLNVQSVPLAIALSVSSMGFCPLLKQAGAF